MLAKGARESGERSQNQCNRVCYNTLVKVVIVDYGAGNLRSVSRAVVHAGTRPLVTSNPAYLEDAEALIVPGVGAAADTMATCGGAASWSRYASTSPPGGRFSASAWGSRRCSTSARRAASTSASASFRGASCGSPNGLKVPHMGWNQVRHARQHPIFDGIADGSYFYFVHTYYPKPEDAGVVIGETEYGVTFPSVVARDNVVATQFHPEKSGEAGLRIYANFLKIAATAGVA